MPEILPWTDLRSLFASQVKEFYDIKSGMHVALLGTTRGGKTTLATGGPTGEGILSHWENCLVLDSSGDPGFIKDYGQPVQKWGEIRGHRRLTISNMSSQSREKIYK